MASAVLPSRNEAHWDVYMRKYTSNSTAHSQLNSRFNPNPNPNPNFNLSRQVQNVSALPHLRQGNEPSPRAIPSPAVETATTNVPPFSWKPNAVHDLNDSFHREYVTFNLASYSRRELKDLKKRLISDLNRVRGVLNRIESHDFVSRTSREVLKPTAAPELQQNQPTLPPHHQKPGGKSKSKKISGQKRALAAIAAGKEPKRQPVVEGDKFFVTMMRKCGQILTKLMKHKNGWVFNTPVDVKSLGLYDYFDIIKHPMDLGTVKLRLDRNEYRTPQDFAADVRLTFNNAMTYNPKGQDVHAMAEKFLIDFEEMFKPAYKKYEAEHQKVATIMQVNRQKDLSQPALIPPQNVLHEPLPVTKRSDPERLHSTLLNQHQFQVQNLSAPPAPFFVPPAVKTPPPQQPVIMPRSAKLPKPKAKDPNKRQMTFEEKAKLGVNLQNLPPEKMGHVVQIVKRRNPNVAQEDDEIELDFEVLDNETLWELDRFVSYHKKALSAMERQGITEDVAVTQLKKSPEKAPTPEHAMLKNKKGDIGEEDVDIGEEIPVENFPPVQIEKDALCASSGSSSSSSSSSGSDSSSSDSDSGSSSGSESDEDSVQSPYVEAKEI
ncbi:PREDICTED: transcription factor GTE2-like [Nicotiana attenuata]|uniref:Transcription factor gte7 n=2 Tax=Nicotiana attenuata TaxID=49451 RepID=A0A1J6KJC3_NICAT|nr:PREDICTED: transcription factor GTE2-like [Nicotiana attenuata]OIT19385.1 transcription factor gte7 [Nicotiana attenuata]